MKREELRALGVPETALKDIQRIHGEEITKAQQKAFYSKRRENDALRAAITAMLPMLKTPYALKAVLDTANYQYYFESNPKKAAPGATNTQDGEAEQASPNTDQSITIVEEGEGDVNHE